MFGLSWVKIAAGLAVLGIIAGSYVAVYRAGKASERSASLERSIDVLRQRGKTDATIGAMDDARLCAELGGMWNNARCE